LNLTNEQFSRLFAGSAVERVKYEQFVRNIRDVMGATTTAEDN